MLPSLLLLTCLLPLFEALPPPSGVILKPAKQLDTEEEDGTSSPPPNLLIRSRMMAAMNSDPPKNERLNMLPQPLILKRKKLKVPVTQLPTVATTTAASTTPARSSPSVRSDFGGNYVKLQSTIQLPPSADYGVTSLLKTNFVDRKGKVHQNLEVIPIRIGDGIAKKTVSASQLVEGEGSKAVQVRFGPAPFGSRIRRKTTRK